MNTKQLPLFIRLLLFYILLVCTSFVLFIKKLMFLSFNVSFLLRPYVACNGINFFSFRFQIQEKGIISISPAAIYFPLVVTAEKVQNGIWWRHEKGQAQTICLKTQHIFFRQLETTFSLLFPLQYKSCCIRRHAGLFSKTCLDYKTCHASYSKTRLKYRTQQPSVDVTMTSSLLSS